MHIISWNINGLNRRFGELKQLIDTYNPDIVCLQKVRCDTAREQFDIDGYRSLYSPDDSGKWAGVITYVRSDLFPLPGRIPTPELSNNGHCQAFRFDSFALINAYVPFTNPRINGSEAIRREWDQRFREFISQLSATMPVVICGDFNVVLTAKDTCEERLVQNRPCFYRWERDNFSALLKSADLVDTFREMNPDDTIPTFYGNFRHTGIGNRIDYFLISRMLWPGVSASKTLSSFGTGQSVPISLIFNPALRFRSIAEKEHLLEHRTDGSDAFDTLYIDAEKFPCREAFCLPTTGIL